MHLQRRKANRSILVVWSVASGGGTTQTSQISRQSEKQLMQQSTCISNPEFYGDLIYKFKKIIGDLNVSDLFKHIVNHFKSAGYT